MRFDRGYGYFVPSAASIGLGGVTTVLWLIVSYGLAENISMSYRYHQSTSIDITDAPIVAGLICSLTCVAMSVLMIVGVVKNIARYMFPWLAIHFVVVMVSISIIISIVFVVIFTDGVDIFFLTLLGGILGTGTVILVWGMVYLHYKNVEAGVQPIRDTKGKILKLPAEPEKPYHPV